MVPDDWAPTVYDAWLYAREAVWLPLGEAYPDFMQTPAWEVMARLAANERRRQRISCETVYPATEIAAFFTISCS